MEYSPTPESIYTKFAQSNYGEKLASQTRFSTFQSFTKISANGHEPLPVCILPGRWVEMLGDDVHNLRHMAHTVGVMQAAINDNYVDDHYWPDGLELAEEAIINDQEKEKLLLAAAFHDQGEAINHDTPDPLKTDASEQAERNALEDILTELYPGHYNELIGIAAEVLYGANPKLTKFFRAVEVMGYSQTALRAKSLAENPVNISSEEKVALTNLYLSVLADSGSELFNYYNLYPFVNNFIHKNILEDDITRMAIEHILVAKIHYTQELLTELANDATASNDSITRESKRLGYKKNALSIIRQYPSSF